MLGDTGASHPFIRPQVVGVVAEGSRQPHRSEVCLRGEPQVAGRVVADVPIRFGTWKGEENFTICDMDESDVVLGSMVFEAHNVECKGKRR